MPFDPVSPWMVKASRAAHHLDDLRQRVEAFKDQYVRLEQVPTGDGRQTDIILRIDQPIPLEWSAIIGDILHNLRSTLDTLAFEFARLHYGGDLPIAERTEVFGPAAVAALRANAPGWEFEGTTPEVMATHGITFESNAMSDPIFLLNRLWNIDKHRRLHIAVAWPGTTYWGVGEGEEFGWAWGRPPFVDGSVIGTLAMGDTARALPPVVSEMEFRLTEDGCGHHNLLDLLQGWHGRVLNWVIPHAWQVHQFTPEEAEPPGDDAPPPRPSRE